jgi:hypothetical protein
MAEKPAVGRGNPVLPDPPIPSMVRQSMVPEPPAPITKMDEGEEVIASPTPQEFEANLEEKLKEEMDARPKGMIVIKLFENSPYEVEFSGAITGSEVDMAWKAMMKEYRVWKHNLFKKETQNGGVLCGDS